MQLQTSKIKDTYAVTISIGAENIINNECMNEQTAWSAIIDTVITQPLIKLITK
jgi:hypothetical protein